MSVRSEAGLRLRLLLMLGGVRCRVLWVHQSLLSLLLGLGRRQLLLLRVLLGMLRQGDRRQLLLSGLLLLLSLRRVTGRGGAQTSHLLLRWL